MMCQILYIQITNKKMALNNKKAPPFLLKTYHILQNPQHNHIVRWNEQNNGFIIADPEIFSSQVLPQYFKHNNMHSYIRQLNMYGFSKKRGKTNNFYYHQYFNKFQPQQIALIQRKIQHKPSKQNRPSLVSIDDQISNESHLHLLKMNQLLLVEQITNLQLILQEIKDLELRQIFEDCIDRYIQSQNNLLVKIVGNKKDQLIQTTQQLNFSLQKIK